MDLAALLITTVAGVAMGFINNIAGGAGVFALWSFQYACGLSLWMANPTTRLGALGVGLFAWLGFLRAGVKAPARAWRLALFAIPGAFAGNLLALKAPDLLFRVYLATVLVLLLVQQNRAKKKPQDAAVREWIGAPGCFLIGVHMGFAQIGTGTLRIAHERGAPGGVVTEAVGAAGTFPPTSKKVYERVMVVTSLGSLGSITKATGHSRLSPGFSVYSLKQKHSSLLKWAVACLGA